MPPDTLPARVYCLLLRLLPREFRTNYGEEMHLQFRDDCRHARELGGRVSLVAAFVRAVLDVGRSALREWSSDIASDVRHAFRILPSSPVATSAVIVTLGVAFAFNIFTFGLLDVTVFRTLPYPDAERLVRVTAADSMLARERVTQSEYRLWREQSQLFSAVAAYTESVSELTIGTESVRVRSAAVTPGFFEMFGAGATMGSLLDLAGRDRDDHFVAVSQRMWSRLAQSGVQVGDSIRLDGKAYLLTGVIRPKFRFLNRDIEVWHPLHFPRSFTGNTQLLQVFARLQHGISRASAEHTLVQIQNRLVAEEPFAKGFSARVLSVKAELIQPVRSRLVFLFVAAVFVYLIAATNVVILQLARYSSRLKEFAIRRSLGASSMRLVRAIVLENCLAACAGCLLSIILVQATTPYLMSLAPQELAAFPTPSVSAVVLAFAAILSLGIGAGSGIAFAVSVAREDLIQIVNCASMRTFARYRRRVAHELLSGGELAITTALLVVAVLLLQSLIRVNQQDLGFRPERLITATVSFPVEQGFAPHLRRSFYDDVLSRVARLPGVESAALITWLPFTDTGHWWQVAIEGAALDNHVTDARVGQSAVSPELFRTLGMRLKAGRVFEGSDTESSTPVAVVNEAFVRSFLGATNPTGRRIKLGTDANPWLTIVGVVSDLRHVDAETTTGPETYVPHSQYKYLLLGHIVARVRSDPAQLVPRIRSEIVSANRTARIEDVQTMEQRIASSVLPRRFQTVTVIVFGSVALLLACTGVYGAMASAIARRRYEIAVRLAVGAQPSQVKRSILLQGVRLACLAASIGCGIALCASGYLQSFLYGVSTGDPLSYAAVWLLIVIVVAGATWLPARTAARVEPIELLRTGG